MSRYRSMAERNRSFPSRPGLRFFLLCTLAARLLAAGATAQQLPFTSSSLPIVVIETNGEEIPDEPKIPARMGIIRGTGDRNHIDDPFTDYDGYIGIELRGNSSLVYDQKQFLLETRDEHGEGLNVSLMDFPRDEDWILYAPAVDKSLLRNVLVYHIARETGRYASRTRFCELVVNGDYRGVYVFMENIKRDRNRVNISIMDPATTCGDELTGGYIIAIDHSATEFQLGFSVSEDSVDYFSYWYIYPKSKHINDHQRWHIMHHVRDFENTMHGADYADPHTGYHQWIDVDSFVDYVLLNEWANNVDAFVASLYLHKDRASISDKIVAGPVWDFNVAFGNADYAEAFHTSGWRSHYGRVPFWWRKLLHDQGFVSALERRWGELRRTVLHDRHVMNVIDSLVTLLDEAQRRHFDRWDLLGRYHWPNAFVGETWQDEIDYLKDWILARMIWMDDSISTILWKDEVTSTRPAPNPHAFSLQAYPVPSAGDVTALIYMPPETNGTLVVRDVLGREVYQLPVGGRGSEARHVPLSLHHLPRGVYMLAIRSAGMTPAAARIVLTR